jgi:hypothetical protein
MHDPAVTGAVACNPIRTVITRPDNITAEAPAGSNHTTGNTTLQSRARTKTKSLIHFY